MKLSIWTFPHSHTCQRVFEEFLPVKMLRFPVKIILYNFHFSAILPFNRFVNTGDIPLTINGLKLRTSIKRKIEEVDEVL